MKWNTKLFEDKVALDSNYHYDGISGGENWREKIRGYCIGCCPQSKAMLDWAEHRDETPIAPQDVRSHNFGIVENPEI